ncbi:MAG: hypothetical protein J07HQW1_00679 [Haloquadratum walsbyi J07HQW1]|uniref:Uncharacterized protein n=1 Tax=Haloquadratum walsbyi J07HQW1 TaxID=1238424 RepID=U1N2C4_9EURY|nr:MAG: hypothetical protein J07HQW1_00679 [Haloquadratum walsbyi J07HQW1]
MRSVGKDNVIVDCMSMEDNTKSDTTYIDTISLFPNCYVDKTLDIPVNT